MIQRGREEDGDWVERREEKEGRRRTEEKQLGCRCIEGAKC
jgi:hypothetical protein